MKRTLSLLLGLALALLTGCAPKAQEHSAVGFYFDTVVTITATVEDKALLDEALQLAARYETLLSKTREGSDVYKLNHAGGAEIALDPETIALLEYAQAMAEVTGGAFDITIAPAMALWDFKAGIVPDAAALEVAAACIDYSALRLDPARGTAQLPAGRSIDLGGIAKGYIADQVAAFLEERGVQSGLLNFGGNVVLIGEKPDGSPWSIGIQDPAGEETIATLAVSGGAVVTSGIYERGFLADGVRYHHILDPKTGWPVQNALASVTIAGKDSMEADALSTACFVFGLEEGMALIEARPGVEAVFITQDGMIHATKGAKLVG